MVRIVRLKQWAVLTLCEMSNLKIRQELNAKQSMLLKGQRLQRDEATWLQLHNQS